VKVIALERDNSSSSSSLNNAAVGGFGDVGNAEVFEGGLCTG
jgi:hypothetical protein